MSTGSAFASFWQVSAVSQEPVLFGCSIRSLPAGVLASQGVNSWWSNTATTYLWALGTVDGRNPNHQLIDRQFISWFLGFQPSFWWCRISQPSTVCQAGRCLGLFGNSAMNCLNNLSTARNPSACWRGLLITFHFFSRSLLFWALVDGFISQKWGCLKL